MQEVASSRLILFYRILLVQLNYGRLLEELLLKTLARFLFPLDVLFELLFINDMKELAALLVLIPI
jgi:hypothetical protein